MRLVSLIASATEIIHLLGMGSFQVGRSHECDYPPSVTDLPICTAPRFSTAGSSSQVDLVVKEALKQAVSVYRVFDTALRDLRPTHILTQTQCNVCAVSLNDVEQSLSERIATDVQLLSLEALDLGDVWEDIIKVSAALEVPDRGRDAVERLQTRLEEIAQQTQAVVERPSVACIEWIDPLMVAGNWVPELVSLAGGKDLFGQPGAHSPYLSWDALVKADPEVLLIMPCGYDMDRSETEIHWLTQKAEWHELGAVARERVFLCEGNQYFNRPGPRLVESAQILAEVLHPTLFEPRMEGTGWRRFRQLAE